MGGLGLRLHVALDAFGHLFPKTSLTCMVQVSSESPGERVRDDRIVVRSGGDGVGVAERGGDRERMSLLLQFRPAIPLQHYSDMGT